MAALSEKNFNELNKHFEIDPDTVFEFGWCNVADAVDRESGHDVRLYLPRNDVWSQSTLRKLILPPGPNTAKFPMRSVWRPFTAWGMR